MSLEEVEAAMRSQSQPISQSAPPQENPQQYYAPQPRMPFPVPQVPEQRPSPQPQVQRQVQPQMPVRETAPAPHHERGLSHGQPNRGLPQPLQILQNPNRPRHSPQPSVDKSRPIRPTPPEAAAVVSRQVPQGLPVITNPQQLMELSEEQRRAYLEEDAKRAKRNHKIFLLSKGNGLMTPQDKSFISRIQLQQLVTATGGGPDASSEAALAEDFYYQVYSQIRGAPRQHPTQPLGHFAQTYLLQTGGRVGGGNRRNNITGENHMQRMQQQVQRAVEAAKLKPKKQAAHHRRQSWQDLV